MKHAPKIGVRFSVVPVICSAGVPPANAEETRSTTGVTIRSRGKLPHWERDGATYFVTFRTADSLPQSVLDGIESERQAIVTTASQLHRDLSPDERRRLRLLSTPAIERYLDRGAGSCHLRNPAIAQQIAVALTHFHGQRYRLLAWCVMPNHVHVVVRIFPGDNLASVMHSWKSFSAKQANRILGSQGAFWQREYYDHLIRNDQEFERAIQYVAENPAKAKLKNWKWVWVNVGDTLPRAAEDGGATKASHKVGLPLSTRARTRAS